MHGIDDKGSSQTIGLVSYPSIDQMWEIELNNKKTKNKIVEPVGSKEKWYGNANQYWTKSEPSYNGVLGGYGHLSAIDVKFSLGFLLSLVKLSPEFKRGSVLDCGAGIGRISKELLCQVFTTVDIVDQCEALVTKAKQILKDKNVRHYFVKGLQELQFSETYDCIWIQWVFSHLKDDDAVKFLKRAKTALNTGGVIILKENHCQVGFVVDKQDCSVTRSTELFKNLFEKAGLKILKEVSQEDWPKDLFAIRMYAIT